MATPKTILLKGEGLYKEASAGGAITPGHLIDRNSAGAFVVHATAGGNALPMFAMENELAGDEITVAYASGDRVVAVIPERGAEVYALLPAAAAAVVIGDLLESNGDGTLRKLAAVADLTDSSTGTADGTIADVGAAFNQATLNNNFADLAAKINALLPNGTQKPVGRALEAVDNSAGGTAVRIRVEIL